MWEGLSGAQENVRKVSARIHSTSKARQGICLGVSLLRPTRREAKFKGTDLRLLNFQDRKELRQHLEGFLMKLNEKTAYARSRDVTFNALLDRYIEEEMPARHSTKGSHTSIINKRLRPQWGSFVVSEIRPRRSPYVVPKPYLGSDDERASAQLDAQTL
jgi:hypothetical protein